MKKSLQAIAVVLLSAVAATAQIQTGKPAPDFDVKDIDGKTHKLSDYKGKVVVIESYNLNCPYVANHYKSGAMQELQREVTGKGAVWLLVSATGKDGAAAKKEIEKNNIAAAAWLDDKAGSLGRPYGVKTTPHMFVIDKNGVLAYQGAIDDSAKPSGDPRQARNYVREAVEKLVAGKPVEVPQTQPYGCGVKYSR
jgi:peroxiredoxin